MTDTTTTEVANNEDDLGAFENEFFNVTTETTETSGEDDAPAIEQEAAETEDETQAEESEAESEETDTDDGDDPDEESAFKVRGRRKTAKERINELTAKAREAERRAEALAAELEQSRSKPTKETDKETPGITPAPGAPDPNEKLENGEPKYPLGEFDPEFVRDMTKFTITEELRLSREKEEQERAEAEFRAAEQALQDQWQEKIADVDERLPEFRTRAANLETTFRDIDPNYGKYLASTIMSMEFGPEVLDYLGGNLAEAQKIVASGPTAATIALGRLEAKFAVANERESDEPRGRQTNAPPPPAALTRGSGASRSVAPDTDDLDAFEKAFFKKK